MVHKSRKDLKILGTGKVTSTESHTNDQKILGDTVQNLEARATWRSGSVRPICTLKSPKQTLVLI